MLSNSKYSLLFSFYNFYLHKKKLQIFFLFIGAVISGFLEVMGLLLLYYLLQVLMQSESMSDSHMIIRALDGVGARSPTARVSILGLAIVIIFIFKNFFIIGYYYYQHLILRSWKNDISLLLMRGYLRAPYEKLLEYNSSTLKQNVNSIVSKALNGYVLSSINLFANIITGLLIASIMLAKYPGITLLVGAVLIMTTFLQNKILKKMNENLGQERDNLASDQDKQVYQGFVALKDTKVSGKEDFFVQTFKGINDKAVANESKILFLSRLPNHLTEIVVIMAIVTICAYVLIDQKEDTGEAVTIFGVLAAIAFRIAPIMNKIISSIQSIVTNHSAMSKMYRELRKLRVIKASSRRKKNHPKIEMNEKIQLENVSFSYPGSKESSLIDINIDIYKGEFIGVVGPSGAGKTTLVDLLLGLISPSSGRLKVDGIELNEDNIRGWQKSIGYVPQLIALNEDTIAANVAFGIPKDKIDRDLVLTCLDTVKLLDRVSKCDHDIDTEVGESGKFFSGGERQRVAIARALYRGADILVLDEATAALDATTESSITDEINDLRKSTSKTIIAISHRLTTLRNTDRIIFLNEGRVVGFDNFMGLYKNSKDFREMADHSELNLNC